MSQPETPNARKLHDRIVLGRQTARLPWPMTLTEGVGYYAIATVLTLGLLGGAGWVSFALIEPSLWRLAPIAAAALLLRRWIMPRVTRDLTPRDLDRRRVELEVANRATP